MSGISVLMKEIPDAPWSFFHVRVHQKALAITRSRLLTGLHLIWDPSLRTWREKCLSFINHPVCDVLLQNPERGETRTFSSPVSSPLWAFPFHNPENT